MNAPMMVISTGAFPPPPPAAAAAAMSTVSCRCLPLLYASTLRGNKKLNALLNDVGDDHHPFPLSAVYRTTLRFHESNRPDPLFIDQYAGCFASKDIQMDMNNYSNQHCLATKFIDDKLLSTINNMDGPKQVVLFTDGIDTRPYRLGWPNSTLVFDISPESVFRNAAQVLECVGAKIPRGSLYLHVPWESSEITAALHDRGFNGSRQSIWVLQGLPLTNLECFEEILFLVSSLAMNGCLFLGELSPCLTQPHAKSELDTGRWIDKLFMESGFRVQLINYDEVAKRLHKKVEPGNIDNILFVAEQLRFSDDQMEKWRSEFQRIEEEGDEEGFEEL